RAMNRLSLIIVGAVRVFVLWLASSSFFIIDPTNQALLLQFGAPQAVVTQEGLHAKLPWQTVYIFDRRLLTVDAPPEEVIAQDKKRLVVDAFARWRIIDPLRFYQTLTDENGAQARLVPILSSNIRGVLGSQNFAAV